MTWQRNLEILPMSLQLETTMISFFPFQGFKIMKWVQPGFIICVDRLKNLGHVTQKLF